MSRPRISSKSLYARVGRINHELMQLPVDPPPQLHAERRNGYYAIDTSSGGTVATGTKVECWRCLDGIDWLVDRVLRPTV